MRFAIFIYEGVEPVDLATFGVLSMARRVAPEIEIFTVAPAAGPVTLANGLVVIAHHGIDDCPSADAIIVTGGPGWQREAGNAATLAFLRSYAVNRIVVSVCTGGMILAAAGLLDGLRATTKREVTGSEIPPITVLRERHPQVRVVEASVVDEGTVVTGGGVTLCIDTTLHLIGRLLGSHVASETARIMEYTAAREANRRAFEPANT
ncbi:MAG TPA: DJ-1/PfpI family protein [Burkholderiaceae bacterium]|nr:DJ-1/PfpI family protein [Burkholderiaceae bacterium]